MLSCFTCLNCGRQNPIKGNSYTNKYCNNSCQQQHRSRSLVSEWKRNQDKVAWRQVPEYIKKYLIEQRGHRCESCGLFSWLGLEIFLTVHHKDHNTHNNEEGNLELICPNCRSQK
jgi:5-methylcytosine-specific restriction endonuclease McrA